MHVRWNRLRPAQTCPAARFYGGAHERTPASTHVSTRAQRSKSHPTSSRTGAPTFCAGCDPPSAATSARVPQRRWPHPRSRVEGGAGGCMAVCGERMLSRRCTGLQMWCVCARASGHARVTFMHTRTHCTVCTRTRTRVRIRTRTHTHTGSQHGKTWRQGQGNRGADCCG